jgi:hypothetical protein
MEHIATIKLQILNYVKANTDNRRIVSYADICHNVKDSTNSYIATALNRLINERLIFHLGNEGSYGYGITAKGLEFLKLHENERDVSKLTELLKNISGLSK